MRRFANNKNLGYLEKMENIGKITKQSLFPVKLCPIVLLGFPTEVASQKSANAIKTNYNMVDWWVHNCKKFKAHSTYTEGILHPPSHKPYVLNSNFLEINLQRRLMKCFLSPISPTWWRCSVPKRAATHSTNQLSLLDLKSQWQDFMFMWHLD